VSAPSTRGRRRPDGKRVNQVGAYDDESDNDDVEYDEDFDPDYDDLNTIAALRAGKRAMLNVTLMTIVYVCCTIQALPFP
jgi:hypothetical protein